MSWRRLFAVCYCLGFQSTLILAASPSQALAQDLAQTPAQSPKAGAGDARQPERPKATTPPAAPTPAPTPTPTLTHAPSSRIAMVLPEGFVPAKRFVGFENVSLGASIVVTERHANAYKTLAAKLSRNTLAAQNIQLVTPGKLERTDNHVFLSARQLKKGVRLARYFLLFQQAGHAGLIAVNAPVTAFEKGQLSKAAITTMLASARITTSQGASPLTATFAYLGPFKPAASYGLRSKSFGVDGSDLLLRKGTGRAAIFITQSRSRFKVNSPLSVAGPLARRVQGVTGLKVVYVGQGRIAGHPAVVHDMQARHAKSNAALVIRQYFVVPAEGGYYRILVVVPANDAKALAGEIKKVVASFKIAS